MSQDPNTTRRSDDKKDTDRNIGQEQPATEGDEEALTDEELNDASGGLHDHFVKEGVEPIY